jgi:carbonic anhydrase/acetyltransferase-like protein (isoleucine patch superfamily)
VQKEQKQFKIQDGDKIQNGGAIHLTQNPFDTIVDETALITKKAIIQWAILRQNTEFSAKSSPSIKSEKT